MGRRLRPLIQGDLDGLCGVYSLLNAVQWALHSYGTDAKVRRRLKLLSYREQQALFDTLLILGLLAGGLGLVARSLRAQGSGGADSYPAGRVTP